MTSNWKSGTGNRMDGMTSSPDEVCCVRNLLQGSLDHAKDGDVYSEHTEMTLSKQVT